MEKYIPDMICKLKMLTEQNQKKFGIYRENFR